MLGLYVKINKKYLTAVYGLDAISNVFLNLLFIPRYGALGDAIASLLAQILTSLVIPAMSPVLRENTKLMIDGMLLRGILRKEKE